MAPATLSGRGCDDCAMAGAVAHTAQSAIAPTRDNRIISSSVFGLPSSVYLSAFISFSIAESSVFAPASTAFSVPVGGFTVPVCDPEMVMALTRPLSC